MLELPLATAELVGLLFDETMLGLNVWVKIEILFVHCVIIGISFNMGYQSVILKVDILPKSVT